MGNESATNFNQSDRRRYVSENKPYNSRSMDMGLMGSKMFEKIHPINFNEQTSNLEYQDIKSSQLIKSQRRVKEELSPRESQQKLAKLNQKNDQLRKQLIRISAQLTAKLQKKKFDIKPKDKQIDPKENNKLLALKKQLENAYKQIDFYKRTLADLKPNQNIKNEEVLTTMENKIKHIDQEIQNTLNNIEAAKIIERNQQKSLKLSENESKNPQYLEVRGEIEKMKGALKKSSKTERKKQHSERLTQEYMFQLERRMRQLNGQYLPELKSYANKHFQPEPKYEKKKKSEDLGNFRPARWEFRDAEDQLQSLKVKHQEYHKKMEKALKLKNDMKDEQSGHKIYLQNNEKIMDILKHKKQRYLQLVMGNLQFLMNEEEPDLSGSENQYALGENGLRTVTKGKDIQNQIHFDDHPIFKGAPLVNAKIVSVHVWLNPKKQITTVQAIYTNGKQFFVGNKSAQNEEPEEKDTFQIDEGDYIKNIMGSFNKKGAIEFLAFNSSRGKAKQFGKQMVNGLNFTLGLSKKQKPVCISGSSFYDGSYWRLNKISIDVAAEL